MIRSFEFDLAQIGLRDYLKVVNIRGGFVAGFCIFVREKVIVKVVAIKMRCSAAALVTAVRSGLLPYWLVVLFEEIVSFELPLVNFFGLDRGHRIAILDSCFKNMIWQNVQQKSGSKK